MTQILVVDDEGTIRSLLVFFLTLRGYQTEVAANGPQALSLASRLRPRAIFLDVSMPGMDGIEILQRLQRVVPQADRDTAARLLELGAREVIQKPFDFQHLERCILAKLA